MKISKEKKSKISEQILFYLFQKHPLAIFTSHIAREVARDEDFVKKILNELKAKDFVVEIKKNKKGKDYIRRSRWRLSSKVQSFFSSQQKKEYFNLP